MEHFESTFDHLLKYLYYAIPLVSAVTIGLVVGVEAIDIESISVPVRLLPFITLFLLGGIYLQCIRSASILLNSIETSYKSADSSDKNNFAESNKKAIYLRKQNHICNPFLSVSEKSIRWDSFPSYIGVVINLIPPMLALLFFTLIFSYKLGDMILIIILTDRFNINWALLGEYLFLYGPLSISIYFLIFLFQYKIYAIMVYVNPEDTRGRLICLVVSLAAFLVISALIIMGMEAYFFVKIFTILE